MQVCAPAPFLKPNSPSCTLSLRLSPRFRYQDLTFLRTLLDATKLLYSPESSGHTKLVQLSVIHMMLTQHSLFLPTMLTSKEEETPDSPVKGDRALRQLRSVVAVIFHFHPHSRAHKVLPPSAFRVNTRISVYEARDQACSCVLKVTRKLPPVLKALLVYRGCGGAHVVLSGAGVKSLGIGDIESDGKQMWTLS